MINSGEAKPSFIFRKILSGLALSAGLLILPSPARAITFTVKYDTSVTTLTNAPAVEAAFAAATQVFTNQFTNPITIYLSVYWGNTGPFSGGVGLGSSSATLIGTNGNSPFTYLQVTNALRLLRSTADDSNAVLSLPAADPLATNQWWMPMAEARALRTYLSPTATNSSDGPDGEVGFGSTYTYTFSPTNRAVPGAYDFIGIAEHEISEVMGRTCGMNRFGDGLYVPFDLFRFTNNGARSTQPTDKGVYFSVTKGLTAVKYFYTNVNTGDIQDWLAGTTPDIYDATAPTGKLLEMTPADFTALDVLGYNGIMATNPFYAGIKRTNGTYQLTFTNNPGANFSVMYATNLTLPQTNWTFLGNPTQSTAGHYLYIDTPATTTNIRLYRIRSP